MNVISVMTLKNRSEYLSAAHTLETAADRLHDAGGALPVVDVSGEYLGIVNERMLLWALYSGEVAPDSLLVEISDGFDLIKTGAAAECEEITDLACKYGVLPVTDDRGMFIGTVLASDLPCAENTRSGAPDEKNKR